MFGSINADIDDLAELYRGHKVVAFPLEQLQQPKQQQLPQQLPQPRRGREPGVADNMGSTSGATTTTTSPRPRPRSLSAGRSRNRNNDLVQDVYDRLGMRRNAPIEWIAKKNNNSTSPAAVTVDTLDTTEDFDFVAASPSSPFSKTHPNVAATTKLTTDPPPRAGDSSSHGSTSTTHSSAYPERFRTATRGRTTTVSDTRNEDTDVVRRSRSLSRGRMAQRWPPAVAAADPRPTTAGPVAADTDRLVRSPVRTNTTTIAAAAASLRSSPTRYDAKNNNGGGLSKSYSMGGATALMVPDIMLLSKAKSHDWRDERKQQQLPEQQPLSSSALGGGKRESPTDEISATDEDHPSTGTDSTPPVSLQDRISAYTGTTNNSKGGTTNNNKKKTSTRVVKNYKPAMATKQYAAQFAVREKPPKVDIYERGGKMDEKKEDDVVVQDNNSNNLVSAPMLDSSSEHSLRHAKRNGNKITNSARNEVSNNNGNLDIASKRSQHSHSKSVGGGGSNNILASAFLAAINPQPISPKHSSPKHKSSSAAPIAEISGDGDELGNGSVHSVAVSSVSADDVACRSPDQPFGSSSSRKPSWQERNRLRSQQQQFYGMSSHNYSSSPTGQPPPQQQQSSSSALQPKPDDDGSLLLTNLVDDRVRAHMADLETKLGAQMRRFMQQMDDKILMRVEAMEGKINQLQASIDALTTRSTNM